MTTAQHAVGLKEAQHAVGLAIGACLVVWYVPVGSGFVCNAAENRLIREILEIFKETDIESKASKIFWFHRKRMLFFNVATYAPWVGTSLQILEVYSIGQFTIKCILDPSVDINNDASMVDAWAPICEDMFSGTAVVESYEQFTGETFPQTIKPTFMAAVDTLSSAYRSSERIPGLLKVQEGVGELMQGASEAANEAAKSVRTFIAKLW